MLTEIFCGEMSVQALCPFFKYFLILPSFVNCVFVCHFVFGVGWSSLYSLDTNPFVRFMIYK